MSYKSKTILIVVPARGGSKGIKRKNLRVLGGKSLVARAACIASEYTRADNSIISTEDSEIGEEAMKYGVDFPFFRPEGLATDRAKSKDMWRDAWIQAEKYYKKKYDFSILLEPTSPFRKLRDIDDCLKKILEKKADLVMTVSRTPASYTPEKSFIKSNYGMLKKYKASGKDYSLRQSIKPCYHKNGICYIVTRKHLIENNKLFETDNIVPILINRNVVNIDSHLDLKLAELLIN